MIFFFFLCVGAQHWRLSRRGASRHVLPPETVGRSAGSAGAYWDGARRRDAPAHEAHRAGAVGVGHGPTPFLATPAGVSAVVAAAPAAAPSVAAVAVPAAARAAAVVADRRGVPVAVGEEVADAAVPVLAHGGRLSEVGRRATAWRAEENGRPRPRARPCPGTGPWAAPIP